MALGLTGSAVAAPLHGTIVSYKHHNDGTGTLVVKTKSGSTPYFIVSDKGRCGYTTGQAGGPLPGGCKKLGKYIGSEVDVVKKAGTKHATTLVSVYTTGR